MKKGDFITKQTLLDRGFTFYCFFAGYHVYRKLNDETIEYVFHDYIKQEIASLLNSTQ
jgi:hypothetical protein